MKNAKIRKKWLWILIARSIVISLFLCTMLLSYNVGLQVDKIGFVVFLFLNLICFFVPTLAAYVLYRCAYKKPGTALLTCNLVFSLVIIPAQLINVLKFLAVLPMWLSIIKERGYQLSSILALSIIYSTIFFIFIFEILWIVYGFKLRALNKKTQREILLEIPECKAAIETMQGAKSIEDLNVLYGAAVRKFPKIAGHVKKRYKETLTNLK